MAICDSYGMWQQSSVLKYNCAKLTKNHLLILEFLRLLLE